MICRHSWEIVPHNGLIYYMESMLLNNDKTLLLERVNTLTRKSNTLTRKSKSQMLVWQMMRNDERGGWQGLLAMKRGEMGGRLHAVGCDDGAALRLVLKKPSNHTHHPPSPALLLKKKPPVCSYNTHHLARLICLTARHWTRPENPKLQRRNGHQQILCQKCNSL